MPFVNNEWPSLGLPLLKACLIKEDISCDIFYANLVFEKIIGKEVYTKIPNGSQLLAEILFSEFFWGKKVENLEKQFNQREINVIKYCLSKVEAFIEYCLTNIQWDKYSLVGFTVWEGQVLACLSLARMIKKKFPDKTVAFGGPNCRGIQGETFLEIFPFVDYVFQGEGEYSFTEFVKCFMTGNSFKGIAGIKIKTLEGKRYLVSTDNEEDLNKFPIPVFDDWVEQKRKFSNDKAGIIIPYEMSRGCYWGRCKICSTSKEDLKFRRKKIPQIINELNEIRDNYKPDGIIFSDSVVALKQFVHVLNHGNDRLPWPNLIFMTRADLKKEHLKQLKSIRIKDMQIWIGIESVNPQTLMRMDKGCSLLENLQVIKWCTELNITVNWNILYGSLNEDISYYNDLNNILPSIYHLHPALHPRPVNVLRFSGLYDEYPGFNYSEVKSIHFYDFVYPGLEKEKVDKLAFQFYFPETVDNSKKIKDIVQKQMVHWKSNWNKRHLFNLLIKSCMGYDIILDSRKVTKKKFYRLTGEKRIIFQACDTNKSLKELKDYLASGPYQIEEPEILKHLEWFMDKRLILEHDHKYLSLAVSTDTTFTRLLFFLLPLTLRKIIYKSRNLLTP
jgi:ribosomal peptide maturation radical SAM protein 1